MKNTIITFALLALTSCHILQKDKLTLKKLTQKEELQLTEQRNTLSLQSQLLLIDTSHNDFTVLLYPKGKFSYSITNGFEGEAKQVMIKGKNTRVKILEVKADVKQDSATVKAKYSNEKESSTRVKKEKLSAGFNWGWLLIFPIVYFLYHLYKSFNQEVRNHL